MPSRQRSFLAQAERIVLKVGSSSLTTPDGGIDQTRLRRIVTEVSARREQGQDVVLVTSGAIAAGLGPMKLAKRPKDLATQQAAASVGQGLLMAEYAAAFAEHGLTTGQVLLTADDLMRRTHHANAQRALEKLLQLGVLPIVNENDTVATHEIRFGDNDRLAALVAHLVHAQALVLLSDVDALYDAPPSQPGAQRVAVVSDGSELAAVQIGSAGSRGVGTGGMVTKVDAARIAASAGIPTLITSADLVQQALAGQDVGTWFTARAVKRSARMMWLQHVAKPAGQIVIDAGAVAAVVQRGKSLLPAGAVSASGRFEPGDAVEVLAEDGTVVARGLINYSAKEVPELIGHSTKELAKKMGEQYEKELIHRDSMVLLADR